MGAIIRWILIAIRDFLNGQIDAEWKAKQEQLQQDAAAHQRQHAQTEAENQVIEERVEQRETEIVANEVKELEIETKRVAENERIEKTTSLKDLWFPDR